MSRAYFIRRGGALFASEPFGTSLQLNTRTDSVRGRDALERVKIIAKGVWIIALERLNVLESEIWEQLTQFGCLKRWVVCSRLIR